MKREFLTAALATTLLGTISCNGHKPAETGAGQDSDMTRLDNGKDAHFLAYSTKDAAGREGNIEVGCDIRILRAEVKGTDGKSTIATATNGFTLTRRVPARAAVPLTGQAVLDEMTRDLTAPNRDNLPNAFDFNNVCDPQGHPRAHETQAALRAALAASARGGTLVKNRRPQAHLARSNLVSNRR